MGNTHKYVTVAIQNDKIASVLSSAFESGGVRDWMKIGDVHGEKEARKDLSRALTKMVSAPCWLPLSEYGTVCCIEVDGSDEIRHTLNLDSLRRGLAIFAEKYPHHFADMMNEDGDMTTGDVLVQCCIFGEVKYQ